MEKKITKVEKFGLIIAELESTGNVDPMLLEFLQTQIEQTQKKNANRSSTGERKPTKTQIENVALASELHEKLSAEEYASRLMTMTEIAKELYANAYTSQKLTAVAKPLVESGVLVKTTEKGKSLYKLAIPYVAE